MALKRNGGRKKAFWVYFSLGFQTDNQLRQSQEAFL
jgi:hypothetical protein